jgi:two-component system chemotaxis response regulator CheV
MPDGVEGLISLRGSVIPVISLATVMKLADAPPGLGGAMMVAEYSKRNLGFLVHEVDRIIRVDWEKVRAPDTLAGGADTYISAVTELADGRLVSILDVEQILANTFGESEVGQIEQMAGGDAMNVFFVDDSVVARKKIAEVLDKLAVNHKFAQNGLEAWTRLSGMASRAQQTGTSLHTENST